MLRMMHEDSGRKTFALSLDINDYKIQADEKIFQYVFERLLAKIADEVYKNGDFGKNLVKKIQTELDSDMGKGGIGSLVAKTIAIDLIRRMGEEKKEEKKDNGR